MFFWRNGTKEEKGVTKEGGAGAGIGEEDLCRY
jgi:hypothetical protein